MLTKLATAMTVTGLVAAAPTTTTTTETASSTPSTTTAVPSATTTTAPSTTIAPPSSTTSSTVVKPAIGTAHADAYYGNPKVGVQVATATPGLYPLFNGEPDLAGFAFDGHTAAGQAPPPHTTEPQPVCSPSKSLKANKAPNLYCEADPDGKYKFPMATSPAHYDLAVSATPDGWYHSPDQTVPIAKTLSSCQGAPKGVDACRFEGLQPPHPNQVTWFDYIGIFRLLVVKVTNSSGQVLSGVKVTLTCTPPAGTPSFACPPSGEQNNLAATGANPVTTGANGEATFSGVYLPTDQVDLVATPPTGYSAGSVAAAVPSPVTASTTTSAEVSNSAETPVVLPIVLAQPATATTTTTTTTVAPKTTTTAAAPTTAPTTAAKTAARTASTTSLAFTGTDAWSLAEDGVVLLAAGGLLLGATRRRRGRGDHFKQQ